MGRDAVGRRETWDPYRIVAPLGVSALIRRQRAPQQRGLSRVVFGRIHLVLLWNWGGQLPSHRPGDLYLLDFMARSRVDMTTNHLADTITSADLQKSLGIVGGGGNYPGRRLAQSSPFPRSRRLHYLSTNGEVLGGVARTTADWIGGGKRRCDNDL